MCTSLHKCSEQSSKCVFWTGWSTCPTKKGHIVEAKWPKITKLTSARKIVFPPVPSPLNFKCIY